MATSTPHFPVREDWLALTSEEVLAPEQVILDPHHHLWDRPEGRYRAEELYDDVLSGHDVRASIFVQCRTGYREDLAPALQPVGEVETIRSWCRHQTNYPAAIVAFADLQLGDRVRAVLDALAEAGEGLVRGIRNTTAYHPHPAVRSNPQPPPDGLLRSSAFLDGARIVAEYGLSLDVWAYQTQLDEVFHLAKAVPELTIIVDHCGGPLGVGPYHRGDPNAFAEWREALSRLADLHNTRIKIGGFGLSVMGYRYAERQTPPLSSELAADWSPFYAECLECFGARRAMFESNFPVDKGQFGYRTLWNAFKRLAGDLSAEEREDLFWRSAAGCYRIDDQIFANDRGRTMS
ncbi:amidohydrolase family protein [Rhizobium halophytocola]|uniref:TIM-barrel fold metal-dependent hydrolase n=1 Tax=Rhizobium halophytocola TaxID=735519 RepID=A0ABS4E487_9HYPH|nr:amidohydrolase family protein [Rhizobium halophytocola]MBP1852765.1 putative TIM-barrel fold metal-dependent hydrolase [Rhizobium halophytocola]